MDDWDEDDDGEPRRPLVLERFRRLGWLAVVLAPLLGVSLAQTAMSLEWALILFVGGMVAVVAWRQRGDDDG